MNNNDWKRYLPSMPTFEQLKRISELQKQKILETRNRYELAESAFKNYKEVVIKSMNGKGS